MTSVLDRVAEIRSEDNAMLTDSLDDLRTAYYEIAVRDFLGKAKPEDARALLNAMDFLALTEADFAKTRDAIATVCQAVAQLQHAEKSAESSSERRMKAQREWRIANARAKRAQRLVNLAKQAASELYNAQQAHNGVVSTFPELFSDAATEALAGQIKHERKLIDEAEKHAAARMAEQEVAELNRILSREGLNPVTTLDDTK